MTIIILIIILFLILIKKQKNSIFIKSNTNKLNDYETTSEYITSESINSI
jgi:hypothetical protein